MSAEAGRQCEDGILRPAVDRLSEVAGHVEDEIAERREVVRREVVAGGEVRDELLAGSIALGVGKREARASTQDELRPRGPPELQVGVTAAKSLPFFSEPVGTRNVTLNDWVKSWLSEMRKRGVSWRSPKFVL
jgi:hypothetical protein